tara:strand:- start:4216 stop:4593 length:378 start_codon:yes stop_codon:yes gene_type:complete
MKKKITLIIGLLCSGKTTLLNTLNGINIDDIDSLNQLPNVLNNNLNITSHFIFKEVREKAISILKEKYDKNIFIDLIFFENNIKKCLKNLEKRGDEETKKVKNFIVNFSQFYNIPSQSKIYKIKT